MSKNLKRFFALLLVTSMLVGCSRKDGSDVESSDSGVSSPSVSGEYYAQLGAAGDGRSVTNPAGSLDTVIENINADGYTTGHEVTVYIMNSGSEGSAEGIFLTYPSKAELSYTARITFKSYDTLERGSMAFDDAWSNDPNNVKSMNLLGATVFENLRIIDSSNSDNKASIFLQGHDLSIVNCDMLKSSEYKPWKGNIYAGANGVGIGNIGQGGVIDISDATQVGKVFLSGISENGNEIIMENTVTLKVDSLKSLCLDSGIEGITTTFKRDVNIILNDCFVNFETANIPKIDGHLSIILNDGSVFSNDSVSKHIDKNKLYTLNVGSGGKIEITDVLGNFLITGGKMAYALTEDMSEAFYGKDSINLNTGKYQIGFASNVEEMKKSLKKPESTEGKIFVGWQDNGDGTMKPIFASEHIVDYYVLDGGTGDGRTSKNPAGFVSEVVKSINEDGLGKYAVARVNIMERDNVTTLDKGKTNPAENSFTAWAKSGAGNSGKIANHEATLLITSYGYNGTDASMKHIAFSGIIGENANLIISGPTIFKDIKLLWQRSTSDRPIYANGHELGLVNVKWYKTDADYNTGASYSGVREISRAYITISASADNCGSVVRFESAVKRTVDFQIQIPGDAKPAIKNMGAPSAIYFDHSDIYATLVWGSTYAFTFNKGLSLVANKYSNIRFVKDANLVTVSGGLQIINNSGNTLPALPNNVKYDALWSITTENCNLDITDVVGTFKVPDGIVAVATDSAGITITSKDGKLVLPAGTYSVYGLTKSELASKAADIKLDGVKSDIVFIKGTNVYLPVLKDTVLNEFVCWSDGVNTYGANDIYTVSENGANLTSVWKEIKDMAFVYVSESGNDANSGADEQNAVKTLEKAVQLVSTKSESIKKVIIIGNYKYSDLLPTSAYTIHYSGNGSADSAIELYDDSIKLSGDTVFERIKLYSTTTKANKYFDNNGYSLTIANNVSTDTKNIPVCINLVSNDIKVELNGSSLGEINVNGGAASLTITVGGADISKIKFNGTFTKNVSVAINGGSIGEITLGNVKFNGALQILINSGIDVKLPASMSAVGGVWIVKSEKNDGCSLEFTDTIGNYKVIGGKAAIATDAKGIKYGSYDMLTLSAGNYMTEYIYECNYIYSGDRITVLKDSTIDISQITPQNKEGYIFEGWKMNGTAVEKQQAYARGSVIEACYIAYNKNDFAITGTNVATSPSKDMQFNIEQKNSFTEKLPTVIKSGALLMPTNDTMGHDMNYGQAIVVEWTWDMETRKIFTPKTLGKQPTAVPAGNIVKEGDIGKYVISVSELAEKDYYTYYSVKGYIRYYDVNGIERIVYTEYFQTNLYRAALDKMEKEGSNTELEAIKYYVEVTRKELYMAENYNNRTNVYGYNADGSISDPNRLMYTLKNGLNVREITIDTGKAEQDAVELVMFTDVHLNYINQEDIDQGDDRTLSTYRGRSWLRSGSSVNPLNIAMEYASFFDKTIVTGDIMDYFSWGTAEMTQKLIFDKYENIVAAIGNHEPTQVVQPDITEYKNTSSYTKAERYEMLAGIWSNDIKYYSEIIKNDRGTEMVMAVVIGTDTSTYTSEQYTKLKADIETAKSKGISILIFQHIPICTNNPEEVKHFAGSGDTPNQIRDYSNQFAGDSKSDAVTMSVYKLIVQNPDIIKGIFVGHDHINAYTEVYAQNADGSFMMDAQGNHVVIPQHEITANAYGNGTVVKITVK